jgi:hypothetical protein
MNDHQEQIMIWIINHSTAIWFGLVFLATVIFIVGLIKTYRDAKYPGLEDLEL